MSFRLMKPVTFYCSCASFLQVDESMIGKQVRCGNCHAVVTVPDLSKLDARDLAAQKPGSHVAILKWLEPSFMKRIGNGVMHLWISLFIIFGTGLFGVIMRAIVKQGDTPRPYWVVFLGCAAVGVAFDLARRIYLYVPSVVIISSEGVNRNTFVGMGYDFAFWPWHMISHAKIEQVVIGFRSARLLTLFPYQGEEELVSIALPRSLMVDQVAKAFAAVGKSLQ